jgi:hypothetical protein
MGSEAINKKRMFWQDHLKKCSESGLSKSAYCKENKLALSTFLYHNRKLLAKSEELPETVNFISIPCPTKPVPIASVQLMLPNGIRIGISSEANESLLKMVLTVAGQITC